MIITKEQAEQNVRNALASLTIPLETHQFLQNCVSQLMGAAPAVVPPTAVPPAIVPLNLMAPKKEAAPPAKGKKAK